MKPPKKYMSKTGIDWHNPKEGWRLSHTWSPLKGCKHNCSFGCIAERWNNRYKWIEKWDEPKFFPEILLRPYNHRKECTVFVVFIGDLFGSWVDGSIIESVLDVCKNTPWHRYLFLTKNPERYQFFEFSKNCWLGATITGQESMARQMYISDWLNIRKEKDGVRTFISLEPLLGKPLLGALSEVDLIICGTLTKGARSIQPDKKIIEELCETKSFLNIYFKKNIRRFL